LLGTTALRRKPGRKGSIVVDLTKSEISNGYSGVTQGLSSGLLNRLMLVRVQPPEPVSEVKHGNQVPFKDYYDWVATKYGGGDPRIVYARTRLKPLPRPGELEKPLLVQTKHAPPSPEHLRYEKYGAPPVKSWALLVIAGKLYLISKPILDLSTSISNYQLEPLEDPDKGKRNYYSWRPRDVEFGVEYPWLIELCQEVGHPVFVIGSVQHGWRKEETQVHISPQCPILGEIGLAKIISAEQMYQDLSYFVGNRMHKSPDIEPPVELSNRQRIIKAGFDLVKSFRHRK
jgi:hypothetical protein